MLDRKKIISYLEGVIESCEVTRTGSDGAIAWQCEQILKRIELGKFDVQMKNITKESIDEFNNLLSMSINQTKIRLKWRKHDHLNTVHIVTVDPYQKIKTGFPLTNTFYHQLEKYFESKYNIKLLYDSTKSSFWAKQGVVEND